jgi:hypothetical protein
VANIKINSFLDFHDPNTQRAWAVMGMMLAAQCLDSVFPLGGTKEVPEPPQQVVVDSTRVHSDSSDVEVNGQHFKIAIPDSFPQEWHK